MSKKKKKQNKQPKKQKKKNEAGLQDSRQRFRAGEAHSYG